MGPLGGNKLRGVRFGGEGMGAEYLNRYLCEFYFWVVRHNLASEFDAASDSVRADVSWDSVNNKPGHS